MKKLLIIPLILSSVYALDSDMDGVEDASDRCPNTPFTRTVDRYGCPKKQTDKTHYYLSAGIERGNYSGYVSETLIFLSAAARKNNLKAGIFYSQKQFSGNNGTNDLILSAYYYSYFQNALVKLGTKLYLPTHFNEKTDYAFLVSASRFYRKISFNIQLQHKIYTEDDEKYKNTFTLSFEKKVSQIYLSPYFYIENSKYSVSRWYSYVGFMAFMKLNAHTDAGIDISFETSQIQNNTVTVSLGYSF